MTFLTNNQLLANRYVSTAGFSINNALYAWGNNSIGQLGLGDTTNRSSPVQVGEITPIYWTATTNGYYDSLGLQSNGTLWSWGWNQYGQLGLNTTTNYSSPVQVGVLSNWAKISGPAYTVYGIQSNGTLWSWGWNILGGLGLNIQSSVIVSSPTQVGSLSVWTQIAGGNAKFLAIQNNGTLWGCGNNQFGGLGANTSTSSFSSPIQIGTLSNWSKIAGGGNSSAVIQSNGTLWVAGYNGYGQLGVNTSTLAISSLVQVGSLSVWTQVALGIYHMLALQSNGTLWSCGYNNYGQLGLGNRTNRSSPVQVGASSNWAQIYSNQYYSLAIQSNGTLWGWGLNSYGELGQNNQTNYSSPSQVGSLSTWSQASCGHNSSLAIKTDATLWSWGLNTYGQLGNNSTNNISSPIQIALTPTRFTQVSCGYNYYSLGIQSPGTLWSWGSNSYGQLGVNTDGTNNTSSPVQVGVVNYWTQIAAGNAHWLAAQSAGTLWACGYNNFGQLGNNTSSSSQGALTPVQIGLLNTWSQVAGGNFFSYALQNSGTLWAWGYNVQGQLGQGNTVNYSSPVQVGAVTTWQQISVNSTSATALALQSAGTLWAWGFNGFGQIGNSNTNNQSNPVQIGALTVWTRIANGGFSNYAIQSNGTLWAWGLNSQGQLGLNTTVGVSSPVQVGTGSTWTQVGAGALQLAAIQNNGTLWMCGYNAQGQIGNNDTTNISSLIQVGSLNKWNFATGARQILAQQVP